MTRARPEQFRGEAWAFGEFELRPERGLLRLDGSEIELAAKPLAMLAYLVRNRDRVVSRRELLDALWPGIAVSPAAFDSVVRDLRRALGDAAADARYVATLRGRGLRFTAPARELVAEGEAGAWEQAARHFERALQALERLQQSTARFAASAHPERAELLVALARARWASGDTAEARRAFLDAANVGRAARDGEVLARAALGFAGRTDITLGVNASAVSLLEEALDELPPGDSALRAEVMARLGTELHYAADRQRPDDLTREAVAMAERTGDDGILAYALTARHFDLQRPEVEPAQRLPLDERVFALLSDEPPSDVLAFALQQRIVDLLECGDGEAFRATLDRYLEVGRALEQPFFAWVGSMLAGTRCLLDGDVEAAEALAHRTLALGERIGSPNAPAAFAGQLYGVRREQGRLAELVDILKQVGSAEGALLIFRAGHAALQAAALRNGETSETVQRALDFDFAQIPRDQSWLATLGTLAPAVAGHGSEPQVRTLRDLLAPVADRVIVVGQGATIHGAVHHHLGLLSAVLGDGDAAARHFDAAQALHTRLGAPLWVARTRRARDTAARFAG